MPSIHPRIGVTRDPELDRALRDAREALGDKPDATLVRELALRGVATLERRDEQSVMQHLVATYGVIPPRGSRADFDAHIEELLKQPVDHTRALSRALQELREDTV